MLKSMFFLLTSLLLVSCFSNQNSNISPIPQNLVKNDKENQNKKNTNSETKVEEKIAIPLDTTNIKADEITKITINDPNKISNNSIQPTLKKNDKIEANSLTKQTAPVIESKIKKQEIVNKPVNSSDETFKVQVSAFKEIGLAEKSKYNTEETLKQAGIIADVTIITINEYYKVTVGSFEKREQAEILKNDLKSLGLNGFIIK